MILDRDSLDLTWYGPVSAAVPRPVTTASQVSAGILVRLPRQRSPGRRRGPGVVGPGMTWIARPQFPPHFRIAAIPEAAQVPRDLHWAPRRRQQFECNRHLGAADPRRIRQP